MAQDRRGHAGLHVTALGAKAGVCESPPHTHTGSGRPNPQLDTVRGLEFESSVLRLSTSAT